MPGPFVVRALGGERVAAAAAVPRTPSSGGGGQRRGRLSRVNTGLVSGSP
ncbi:hypothetical protein Strvi_6451 [Streptomyces violaceusniger Tu 4113]|uniref:Uncharacterized protein n=1 Tax=Streptomyces violaceusniger (strain Tu 4113) TaxID=653045 RepID=G2NVJ6_STRV4|nr:hypothetical protein Strvi_6451 [Streptomyces violaceusniger Tu 4113]